MDHNFEFNEDSAIYYYNGVAKLDFESAVSELLEDEILFTKMNKDDTLGLKVNASDLFAWGCSEFIDLPYYELFNLYKRHKEDKKWGAIKWVCIQEEQKPMKTIERSMIKNGVWDEEMESLGDNRYDLIKNGR